LRIENGLSHLNNSQFSIPFTLSRSLTENRFCAVHTGGDVHLEGTAAETGATVGALAGMVRQSIVLLLQFGGDAVQFGLVEQFVDLGDRDAHRTGGAMVAIGAVAADAGGLTFFHLGVVLLLLGGLKPVEVGLQLL